MMPIQEGDSSASSRTSLKVFIVEDESLVAMDLEERLIKMGYEVAGMADNGVEALEGILRENVDLVVMDIHLRDGIDGVDVAANLRKASNIPVIFITAHADEVTLRRAGQTEPFGYVLKPFDERELRATIEMALYRHRAETRLRKVERWLATTLRSIGDGVIATDDKGIITLINPLAESVTGWSCYEAIGRPLEEVLAIYGEDGTNETPAFYAEAMKAGVTIHMGESKRLRTKDGHEVPLDDSISPIRDDDGRITGCVVVFRDCTNSKKLQEERRRLETKMQETQRLESLGVLAAGIAHDFNNLLTVVTMNASLAKSFVPQESPVLRSLTDIQAAAERAAQLCNQMLAYAGQGPVSMEDICINELTRDTAQLLTTAISKKTALSLDLGDNMPKVKGDRSQLQQVIMNLVINASESLQDLPGKIKLKTRYMHVDQAYLEQCRAGNTLLEGDYLMIEVKDTGEGMPPEVMARIFDPFFTTKFTGRGLGLAAVLGIVRSHGGGLSVNSISGAGTTFRIYMPACAEVEKLAEAEQFHSTSWLGTGYALIVDDEATIRMAGQAVLSHLGFQVDTAEDGMRGLEKILRQSFNYKVVLLDLTMPNLDGREVYKIVRERMPHLPIIIMSGYSSHQATDLMNDGGPTSFIQKPFTVDTIKEKLMALLG
ncbi:PAS domain S-box-containing protein [Prosthecobacter fusiformis]|uniref:histidine kinase n=1 Tax=Prosthecobacter fusiformis TaxID=48464 RepID=A0A4R7SRQ8_9BACT|nr:hybrid sensor histidine kinase/response regulator [Prosthecobacter fusiformis]TDU80848.1 PAS domain S-box-containing protein [Prosthecobacter fusiformis]